MTFSLQNEDSEFALKQIGNEGLTKQILRKGVTWQTPFSGDQVEGYKPYHFLTIFHLFLFHFIIHKP